MKHLVFALTLAICSGNPLWAQLHNQGATIKISGGTSVTAANGVINSDAGALTVNGTLTTPAKLSNTSGATLQGNGQYHIGGDWANDAIFNADTSTVTFEGAQNSALSSGGSAFYKVILDKAGAYHLLPADNMDVTGTLDFQAADNQVVLSNYDLHAAALSGYDATRYVRTTGAGSLWLPVDANPAVFPVGNSNYNPATLSNAGEPDLYKVRVADTVRAGGASGSPLTADAVGRGWFVGESTPGGSEISLTLQWNGSEEQATFDRSQAYVSHYLAGSWDTQPTAAAGGNGPYSLTRTGVTSLSPFAVFDGDFTPLIDISGIIRWEHDGSSGIKDATVTLSGDDTGSTLTPADGSYTLTASNGSNFTVTPTKNINKLNGITIGDALAIQQHIANVNPITDPFKLVAADVNQSNSITTLDATLINQALLGNPAALAQFKTSWRFVPASFNLTAPPWGFPEKIDLTGVNGNVSGQDFLGIKIGDLIESFADPAHFTGNNGDESPLAWQVQDRVLEAGQDIEVSFQADFLENIAAFQFALRFDTQFIQLQSVEKLPVLPLGDDHFGLFEAEKGELRVAWSHHEGFELPHGSEVFILHFKTGQSGTMLSDVVALDDEQLPGLVYNNMLENNTVQLQFKPITGTNTPDEANITLDNWPNPFVHSTTLRFSLPEACRAQLRVLDESGRELWRLEKNYPAGYQQERIELNGTNGALVCELTTPGGTRVCKMISVE